MIFKPKARFEQLDQYLAKRDYRAALEAVAEEVMRRPESFNLLLRQAEILALAGERGAALDVYERLARFFIDQGFYARAIAVTNKIQRLDPARVALQRELAEEIARRQDADAASRDRLQQAEVAPSRPPRAPQEPATDEVAAEPAPADPAPADPAPAGEAGDVFSAAELPPEQVARERAASQFFGAFPVEALESLLSSTSVKLYHDGDPLVREGEAGTSMFLIEEGQVEVRTQDPAGAEVVLATLGPGEFFGEVSVLTGLPRTATVIAQGAVTALEIDRTQLESIFVQHPEVRGTVQRFYEERAHATAEAILTRLRGKLG